MSTSPELTEGASTRSLLMEGREGAFLFDAAYCRQKDKVWFAHGNGTAISESIQGATIVESIEEMELEERKLPDGRTVKLPKDGVWVVEGPSQASDKRNANNRFYPREIWEKWIADRNSPAQQAIRERAMLGHVEHPKDGRTDGNEGALIVTEAKLRNDGTVWCRFELLDTPKGLILQEYTRKRVKWGVSSRGNGTVDEKGRVSPDDYVLETWDAVMRPSVAGSHPQLVRESQVDEDRTTPPRSPVSGSADRDGVALDEDVLRRVTAVEDLCAQSIDDMTPFERVELSAHLREAMQQLRPHLSLMHERVQRATQVAFWKLSAIQEAGTQSVDDIIEGACRDAAGEQNDGDRDAYASVVEELQRRLATTASEAEELREQLEAAESRCLTADWRVQELTEQLAEASKVQKRLRLAEQLLAERPAREVSGSVLDAVDEAIEQVPQLDSFRLVLERCGNEDEVFDLAESLLPAVVKPTRVTTIAESEGVSEEDEDQSRPMLPRGVVASERDIEPTRESASRPKSRGAQLAEAAIVARQKKQTS